MTDEREVELLLKINNLEQENSKLTQENEGLNSTISSLNSTINSYKTQMQNWTDLPEKEKKLNKKEEDLNTREGKQNDREEEQNKREDKQNDREKNLKNREKDVEGKEANLEKIIQQRVNDKLQEIEKSLKTEYKRKNLARATYQTWGICFVFLWCVFVGFERGFWSAFWSEVLVPLWQNALCLPWFVIKENIVAKLISSALWLTVISVGCYFVFTKTKLKQKLCSLLHSYGFLTYVEFLTVVSLLWFDDLQKILKNITLLWVILIIVLAFLLDWEVTDQKKPQNS